MDANGRELISAGMALVKTLPELFAFIGVHSQFKTFNEQVLMILNAP